MASIVKRALRALQSPAYEKARKKNALLPEVHDRATAENAFKLLPLSLLALRISKVDPQAGHEGHGHGPKKRVKGLWTVRIEQHQETGDDDHYMWLYEGSQWRQKVYAVLALIAVFAVVLFPLWPIVIRQGVWYISVGFLGLIGLFFVMAIFRLILFCITVMTLPRGFWLYPNLFEDVGFFDSFRPVWAWQEVCALPKPPFHFFIKGKSRILIIPIGQEGEEGEEVQGERQDTQVKEGQSCRGRSCSNGREIRTNPHDSSEGDYHRRRPSRYPGQSTIEEHASEC